jgi:hypothetical protein
MTSEIAVIEGREVSPMELLEAGQAQAEALMEFARRADAIVTINGNEYVKVEGWCLIGKANNTHAATEWTRPVLNDSGDVIAYEAKINLMKDGQVVGSAISECGMDENVAKGRRDRSGHNAAKSMAQTRATSKAFRMSFAWVAVLAGYKATPAEEMISVPQPPQPPQGTPQQGQPPQRTPQTPASPGLMCPDHGEEWFRRGTMRGYAHKIGDTANWCNMPRRKDAAETPQKPATATGLPRKLNAAGFAEECGKLGIEPADVDVILDGKEGMETRLSTGETWESMLALVKSVIQPGPDEGENRRSD